MAHDVRHLLAATRGSLILGSVHTPFNRVSIDTRTLTPADSFFAIKGPRFDGHDYVSIAVERGASVVVVDRLDDRFQPRGSHTADIVLVDDVLSALQRYAAARRVRSGATVFGVSGSNGKTTTKQMLAAILKRVGETLATRGNLNNHIGLPLTCCELEPNHRFAVVEMGTSRPGDMGPLVEISKPNVAVMTNVGKDHLEFFQTAEGVLQENRLVYDQLPEMGTAVINLDDPLLAPLANEKFPKLVTYSLTRSDATVHAGEVATWPLPIRFQLTVAGQSAEVALDTSGVFQVSNALAAAAAAHAVRVPLHEIVAGLAEFQGAPMRMQIHAGAGDTLFINDAYNANPSSVRASVQSFCESYAERPRWLVLGDMRELGETARHEHQDLGVWLAGQPLERIFLYGRDTRFVLHGLQSGDAPMTVERFRKKKVLSNHLKRLLETHQPVILFKASRGMALEKVLEPLLSSQPMSGH